MDDSDFVMCPLVDKKIENIDCVENADAADGIIKKEAVPERFKQKPEWEQVCKNVNGTDIDVGDAKRVAEEYLAREKRQEEVE